MPPHSRPVHLHLGSAHGTSCHCGDADCPECMAWLDYEEDEHR